MALPTGSGSELIKHFSKNDHDSAGYVTAIDGVALHIYTVLSIICYNASGSALTCTIAFNDGSNDVVLVQQSITGLGTFVFNDKFSFTGGTGVDLKLNTSGDAINWHVTYIDQNWV